MCSSCKGDRQKRAKQDLTTQEQRNTLSSCLYKPCPLRCVFRDRVGVDGLPVRPHLCNLISESTAWLAEAGRKETEWNGTKGLLQQATLKWHIYKYQHPFRTQESVCCLYRLCLVHMNTIKFHANILCYVQASVHNK